MLALKQKLAGLLTKEFSGCECEKCFQSKLLSQLRDCMSRPSHIDGLGFFGYRPRKPDLVYTNDGEKLLIECKLLKGNNGCEVRNAFSQLIEYMILGGYRDGCVLCYDKRDSADEFSDVDRWFLKQLPTVNHRGEGISISLLHLFESKDDDGQKFCCKCYDE